MSYKDNYERWINRPELSESEKAELVGIAGNEKEIEERFYRELEFGTAGMRGILGMGTNRINIYNVLKCNCSSV